MSDDRRPYMEPLIAEVRATRERLVRERGGLRGWVRHLRELEEQHQDRLISPREFGEQQRNGAVSRRDGS